jgi:superfamily I DNA/RNA helicase
LQLTLEQKSIVESEDQHILVVANAGTGKTATITKKIHYLLEKNSLPQKMLVSSFSKVAAQELYEKIVKEIGQAKADMMFIGTLHALCYKIVLENLDLLGMKSLTIVGESFITAIAFNRHANIFDKKKEAASYTAMYRKYLTDRIYPKGIDDNKFNAIVEAQEIIESQGKYVFDDLILKTIYLFEKHSEIKRSWQDKFDNLMLDECLPYYTPIHLADGSYKFVGDIVENKESIEVLSYNENNQQQEKCKITGWSRTPNKKQLVKIRCYIRNGVSINNFVVCTVDHKIFTYTRGWVEAGSIKIGDILQIETSAHKDSRYKITDKGKKHLQTLMNIDGKAKRNSIIGNKSFKWIGKERSLKKTRQGNGRGPTVHQKFLYDELSTHINSCWQMEGIVRIPKDLRKKYNASCCYKIDVFNESSKLCIEVDGDSHKYRREADLKKDTVLTELGYKVLRYENKDIFHKIDTIVEEISKNVISKDCIIQAPVVSVDFSSTKENYVYDITVDKCHNFYANGVLVHNCQDNSPLQWKFIKLLRNEKTKTIIVGDAKQNIYAFRGCSFTYMDTWRKEVNAKVFTLTETFRFGKPFAELSNKVIDNLEIDDIYKSKTVTNVKCDNEPVFKCLGIESQTKDVVEQLTSFLDSGFSYKDLSVVYRYNKESIPFIKTFLKLRIPFEIKSGDVFERAELKFIILCMRLVKHFNISDCIDFFSLYSDFVGDKTLTSIYKEVGETKNIYDFTDQASKTDIRGVGGVKKKSLEAMSTRFINLKSYIIRSNPNLNFTDIANIMDMSETKFMLKDREAEENGQPPEDRMEFLSFFYENYKGSDKKDIAEWYDDCLINGHKLKESEKNKIQLKTIHGCKGQSLPIVFLIANRICDTRFIHEPEDVENEKFVLYVSLTRAEKHMYIYIDNIVGFKFNFILPESMIQTNDSIDGEDSLTLKLKENYSKNKRSYRNCLKASCVVTRSTDKAIMFSFNGKSFWTPTSTVGYNEGRYFILDWILKKNQFMNYVEKY